MPKGVKQFSRREDTPTSSENLPIQHEATGLNFPTDDLCHQNGRVLVVSFRQLRAEYTRAGKLLSFAAS